MSRKSNPDILLFNDFTPLEIAEAQLQGEAAKKDFDETFQKIRNICQSFNQIELLSRLAMVGISEQKGFGTPNFNPTLHAFELEIFQAVALADNLRLDWNQSNIAQAVEDSIGLLRRNSTAFREKSLLNLSGDRRGDKIAAVLDRIRTTTQSVRGARHAFQTRAYLRDLADGLDCHFQAHLGFNISEVIAFFENTAFRMDRELGSLTSTARRWVSASDPAKCLAFFREDNRECSNHPLLSEISSRPVGLSETKGTLFAIFEENLRSIFQLKREEAVTASGSDPLWNSFKRISLGFGDVKPDLIQHLHLSNPVGAKPLVSDGSGNYFLFCTQTTFANLIEILDELAAAKPPLTRAIETFKAEWLETKLNSIVSAAFPSGEAHSNAKWRDLDGKEGETDCILLIDKTVGLFEAKSGRITAPAKRGAPERLKRQINELLVDPSRQSARFETLLQTSTESVSFYTPSGISEIKGSDVREVFRINILFDTIGPLSTNTRRLIEAGFIDPDEPMAPCMSVFELETLLDLLPNQISRIHYLRRRCQLERNSLIEADEMDLIALYLATGFHIGEHEFSENGFSIYGWSDRIAGTYDHNGRRANTAIKLKQTAMWSRLLQAIENTGEIGWTRFGYRLCETRYADQWAVQKLKAQTFKRARRVKMGQACHTGVYSDEENRLMPIAICVGNHVSDFGIINHSQNAAHNIMMLAGTNDALVLYWDRSAPDLPYKFVATFKRLPGV